MQKRQPMQRCGSCMTRPSSRGYVAWTGQTLVQAGFSQCWQASGIQCISSSPFTRRGVSSASPTVSMRFHHMPSGTSFSDLQITQHDQQPMQRSWSTTIPQRGLSETGPISP